MKKISILIFSFITIVQLSNAQNGVQNVKGTILDKDSEMPLIGATILLLHEKNSLGTTSDIDGRFFLENVPLGRQAFTVNYLGYESITLPNIEVTAGKEVDLNIVLEESLISLDEIVVKADAVKDRSINEMATVSARQFTVEEVNRYSGGRSDVARLAGNFAGVSTADDSRNDIVIRGNSPTGLLWRLEGIPIPSPNHFSTVGTTGGPVSALNTNLLKNSDFLTSAFPAEYGNALSGVFDLGFRNGNKDEMEYTFQIGAITGFEGMIEGPLSKKNNSSFIVAYRNSFVGVAQAVGADIGTNAVPNYRDFSFKVDLGKSAIGNFTIFGVGGTSDIDFLHDEIDATDLFAADDEDSFADSKFGVVGLKHNLLLDDKSYLRTILGLSGNGVQFSRERFYNQDQDNEIRSPFVIGDNGLNRLTLSSLYNRKFNKKLTGRANVLIERIGTDLSFRSAEMRFDENEDGIFDLVEIYKFNETTTVIQPSVQTKYKLNKNWTANLGINAIYYDLNQQFEVEPRAALNYRIDSKHTINLGFGIHNQTQPIPIQIASKISDGVVSYPNRKLEFSKSNQFVIGHDFKINDSWRSKVEVYYQDISNVPVQRISSSFSVLNVGADFGFPIDKNDLVNSGSGSNKGVELTIEKFFNQGYYFLMTGSLFDSKYKGSDGVERNTAFNNQRVFNILGGKEFKCGNNRQHRFTIDTKITTAGGRFYTPVDLEASKANGFEVLDSNKAFGLQYDSYFRWDVKIGMKFNSTKHKFSQAFYLDIQNITNNENIFSKSYNRKTNQVNDIFQIGFFPNIMYKIEF